MRQFDTGATRDKEDGKLDYEGFLSPIALERYAEYMNKHRLQADGTLRGSDNWQRGMPLAAYIKSGWRHWMDVWHAHRGTGRNREPLEDAICATIFNLMGYLHESVKARLEDDIRPGVQREMEIKRAARARVEAEEAFVQGCKESYESAVAELELKPTKKQWSVGFDGRPAFYLSVHGEIRFISLDAARGGAAGDWFDHELDALMFQTRAFTAGYATDTALLVREVEA